MTTKSFLLAAGGSLLLLAGRAAAQIPMDGTPGGPQRMKQDFDIQERRVEKEATKLVGLMDRALHRMKNKEKREFNEALVERGSLTMADGTVIEKNKKAGEQVIDPRTPKGFGNPFFRAIHVEQNIKVNNLISKFEEAKLAEMKWKKDEDVKANATEEIEVGTGWTPVIAEGLMKTPAVRAPEFMALFEVSPNRVIRRVCQSCDDDFRDIYYRRLTDTYQKSLYGILKNGPFDHLRYGNTDNQCWVDFTLHSTYEDAVAGTNPWQHCHPDPNFQTGRDVGFPSFSGPEKHDANNQNKGTSQQKDYAFYVETPNWQPTAGTFRLDIKGSRDDQDIEQGYIAKISQYLDESPHRIARRVCNDCVEPFRDVYFRHMAPATMSVANVEYFLLESFEPFGKEGFEFNQDFKIYSTYEDAIADTNAWEYCEYHFPNTVGFPGNCRPRTSDAAIPNQWSRITVSGGTLMAGRRHTCLYVEASDEPPNRDVWMSDDEEMDYFFYGDRTTELPPCLDEATEAVQANALGVPGMSVYGEDSVDQKYNSATWFGNPHDTWAESRAFCRSKGMDLCPASVVCPNGAGSPPDGGTRTGDQWVPVLDENNQWIQVGTWATGNSADTCRTHDDIAGEKPVWGLYGQDAWATPIDFSDLVQCCGVADQYRFDDYAGWYDVRRCGNCHDQCFWMGVDGATYDPKFEVGSNPWHSPVAYDAAGAVKGFFTCKLSGSAGGLSTGLDFLENDDGVTSFPYRKCQGEGQPTPKYRMEEFEGCYRVGSPSALPELVGNGQRLDYARCADACRSRNYHYFGRTGEEQCWCGGRTRDDETYKRFGLIPYGSADHCSCDSASIGGEGMCTYRLVDQFDPKTARKQHPCRYLPSQDMRKMCYIACRDGEKSFGNKFMCNSLQTRGMIQLSRKISKHYDEGGNSLHMLGGDVSSGTNLGTF